MKGTKTWRIFWARWPMDEASFVLAARPYRRGVAFRPIAAGCGGVASKG